jgi:hypothetical protein
MNPDGIRDWGLEIGDWGSEIRSDAERSSLRDARVWKKWIVEAAEKQKIRDAGCDEPMSGVIHHFLVSKIAPPTSAPRPKAIIATIRAVPTGTRVAS